MIPGKKHADSLADGGHEVLPSSFRDRAGFVFRRNGEILRQVNEVYRADYDRLMSSGLYEYLAQQGILLPHAEMDPAGPADTGAYKVIKPAQLVCISYPYEWCFSQVKDAALLTLQIQKAALRYGMVLKDASLYNVQFHEGRPVFIDTLSFQEYEPGLPWVAYRQFCEHFLTVLALMSYCGLEFSNLLKNYLDGVPLEFAAKLLPWRTRFRWGLLAHIHMHAQAQRKHANLGGAKEAEQLSARPKSSRITKDSLEMLAASLENAIRRLPCPHAKTEWSGYYTFHNYSAEGLEEKKNLVASYLKQAGAKKVLDLGANNGLFSRIAADLGSFVLSTDIDPLAVEENYSAVKSERRKNLLPLVIDICNPSPGIGWRNAEREPFAARAGSDLVLALALIHHLVISNCLPFAHIAAEFSRLADYLIIEFPGRDDSQVRKLLAYRRESDFLHYNREAFESEFGRYYSILASSDIRGSQRRMYFMRVRGE